MDSRLRVGHAIGKTEEEIAPDLMKQVKMHAPDEGPSAMSSDGKGAYPKEMLETWGKVPEYGGRGAFDCCACPSPYQHLRGRPPAITSPG